MKRAWGVVLGMAVLVLVAGLGLSLIKARGDLEDLRADRESDSEQATAVGLQRDQALDVAADAEASIEDLQAEVDALQTELQDAEVRAEENAQLESEVGSLTEALSSCQDAITAADATIAALFEYMDAALAEATRDTSGDVIAIPNYYLGDLENALDQDLARYEREAAACSRGPLG